MYVAQLRKVADGFSEGLSVLESETRSLRMFAGEAEALQFEKEVAETVAIHFRSAANQCELIALRDGGDKARTAQLLRDELHLAARMLALQRQNSTLGFEASNHYFFTGEDLMEKVLNCRWMLEAVAGKGA